MSGGEREGRGLVEFDIEVTEKQHNKNDGVIVYFNKHLSAMTKWISRGDVYGVRLDFRYRGNTFNILALYRSFDSNIGDFITSFDNYYDEMGKHCNCILLGDFNIDVLTYNVTALLTCSWADTMDR